MVNMNPQEIADADLDDTKFDNDIVCRAAYAWVKGDGQEPYSPAVASLTVMVLDLIKRDRIRRAHHRCGDADLTNERDAAIARAEKAKTERDKANELAAHYFLEWGNNAQRVEKLEAVLRELVRYRIGSGEPAIVEAIALLADKSVGDSL